MTQRADIERALIAGGERGVHSFWFVRQGMPRAAVTVCRLRREGWSIDSLDEPGPAGGRGCRYVVRAVPINARTQRRGEQVEQHEQAALPLESSSPSPPTAHWRADL